MGEEGVLVLLKLQLVVFSVTDNNRSHRASILEAARLLHQLVYDVCRGERLARQAVHVLLLECVEEDVIEDNECLLLFEARVSVESRMWGEDVVSVG